ncbi:MAG TPA: maleylpyruvate isomerase family mycothiol-dependent enzyme [Dermatophilaceae bacterium]|nr:maleylpyruvate isomerase family mycothiol-dependent enzyme [Dermatophilaceae bacterium]
MKGEEADMMDPERTDPETTDPERRGGTESVRAPDVGAAENGFTADVALGAGATAALVETASRFRDADLAGWSLCDGWSRGHVLAHVSRNADALLRLARWASTGVPEEMYPGGATARDAEIEAGAARPVREHVADLRATADELGRAFDRLAAAFSTGGPAAAEVEGRGGYRISSGGLPFVRLREVVYHHVDLDAGFTFEDVHPDLLGRFLDDAVSRLALAGRPPALVLAADDGGRWTVGGAGPAAPSRTSPPRSGDPAGVVCGSRAGLLMWLARRREDGIRSQRPVPSLPRGA